jgi:nucleoside-diphosphate-sugar epimerase
MHDASQPTVAVIGAAGFVGRELLRLLEEDGIRVVAVARGNPEIAADSDFHVVCPDIRELRPGSFEGVVNLAYPTSGTIDTYRAQTDALFRQIESLRTDRGHLIQVSTLTVFGLALDREAVVGPVRSTRGVPYVEAKIAAERFAVRHQAARSLSVDIVRLGNVIGPASPGWTRSLVQRLVTGRPVGVAGMSGFSNCTDVANATSYLWSLLAPLNSGPGVRYHHLAEFSFVPWSEWIGPLANALGGDPVYSEPGAVQLPTVRNELAVAFGQFSPLRVYRTLQLERAMGSWMRTLRSWVPDRAIPRPKHADAVFAQQPAIDRAEQTFLAIMTAQQEFESLTHRDWTPPVTKEQSIERMLEWLGRDWHIDEARIAE